MSAKQRTGSKVLFTGSKNHKIKVCNLFIVKDFSLVEENMKQPEELIELDPHKVEECKGLMRHTDVKHTL